MKTILIVMGIIAVLVLIANYLANRCFDDDDDDMFWHDSYR